jgi:hypothetical protein
MAESQVRIENRAQLIYVLSEACELEHGLSCSYQFAAFSLKTSVDEGVTEQQLEAIQRWKRTILDVAIDEMYHLAYACNLLTAVGGAPHLRRPNFPAGPRMYPPGFKLTLEAFSEETISRFVFIERPEGMDTDKLAGIGPARRRPASLMKRPIDIFAGGQVYETVGHLYRSVEDGLRYLSDKYGEAGLFVSADAQTEQFGVDPAVDLKSAIQAIENIVEQGEGARGDVAAAHYGRFSAVRDEYREPLGQDPSFEPARPVVTNPYSRIPNDVHPSLEVSLVDDPMGVMVCNLFDGCYQVLVQSLARLLTHGSETAQEQKTLVAVAIGVMTSAIAPLGELATRLPAGPAHPGRKAGPSFHMLRDLHALPHKRAAWLVLRERLRELSGYAVLLGTYDDAPSELAKVAEALAELSTQLPDD